MSSLRLVTCLVLASGCAVDAGETTEGQAAQPATSPAVRTVANAEDSYRAATTQAVSASAASAGFTIPAANFDIALSPLGRTLASAVTANQTQLVFVSKAFRRTSPLEPGLYEIRQDSAGAVLYFHDPILGPIDLRAEMPDPHVPVPIKSDAGDWLCAKAPPIIQDYCQRFALCAVHDLWCPW